MIPPKKYIRHGPGSIRFHIHARVTPLSITAAFYKGATHVQQPGAVPDLVSFRIENFPHLKCGTCCDGQENVRGSLLQHVSRLVEMCLHKYRAEVGQGAYRAQFVGLEDNDYNHEACKHAFNAFKKCRADEVTP